MCFIVVVHDVNLCIIIIVTQRDGFRKNRGFGAHEASYSNVRILRWSGAVPLLPLHVVLWHRQGKVLIFMTLIIV